MALLSASLENFSHHQKLILQTPLTMQLKTHMQQIRPTSPRSANKDSYVSQALLSCTHVFIRHDAVCKSLQPPYDGPYPVVERKDKHFIIDINGRRDTVSLDRLKPAHLECIESTQPTTPTQSSTLTTVPAQQAPVETRRVTRSGRHVHWPKHLTSYVS